MNEGWSDWSIVWQNIQTITTKFTVGECVVIDLPIRKYTGDIDIDLGVTHIQAKCVHHPLFLKIFEDFIRNNYIRNNYSITSEYADGIVNNCLRANDRPAYIVLCAYDQFTYIFEQLNIPRSSVGDAWFSQIWERLVRSFHQALEREITVADKPLEEAIDI